MFHVKNAERTFALELGNRLKRARLSAGAAMNPPRQLTQEEASRAVGVSGVTVGAWESGRNEPPLLKLWRLSDFYGVDFRWLAIGEGSIWGAPPAQLPRVSGYDPLEDGIDSARAIAERKERESPPVRRVAEGLPGPATGGGARRSAPPSRGKPKKR